MLFDNKYYSILEEIAMKDNSVAKHAHKYNRANVHIDRKKEFKKNGFEVKKSLSLVRDFFIIKS